VKQLIIDVRIPKDGRTVMHVAGVQGESCMTLTEAIEQRLGAVEHREYTPERHNVVHQSVPNRQTVRRT